MIAMPLHIISITDNNLLFTSPSMEDIEGQLRVVKQDDLESKITSQANKALLEKDAELEEKRLEKTSQNLTKTLKKIKVIESRLEDPRTKLSQRKQLRDELEWFTKNELDPLNRDLQDIKARLEQIKQQQKKPTNPQDDGKGVERLENETEREFLTRTGKITAFGNQSGFQEVDENEQKSHIFLRAPGFAPSDPSRKEAKVEEDVVENLRGFEATGDDVTQPKSNESEDEYTPDAAELDLDEEESMEHDSEDDEVRDIRNMDDGDEQFYQKRLAEWCKKRSSLRKDLAKTTTEEWHMPHPTVSDAVLNSQFRLPGDIYPSLFQYQRTCVQWLWELYLQKTGGIIGDEMGLGKTIQVVSFIAGLHYSGLLDKPVIVVVPATVMMQWVNEFHTWWPPLRCAILHSIGSGMSKSALTSEEKIENMMANDDFDSNEDKFLAQQKGLSNAKNIVDRVVSKGHVLITTYVGLRIYSKYILPHQWGYAVLDEGHKIRNPNSHITLTCKQLKTHNRIILSGTPIQNNLIELWSLFDFVFPGRLGTLPVFEQQFSIPINMGGYANASNVQVQTGYKCAVVLRDLISPYLLRRLKSDVAQDLPKKEEMVLFVKLTQYQQDMYEKFLSSEDLHAILKGKRNMLTGVDTLRKICNHPDLVDRELLLRKKGYNYGIPNKSGKMLVLKGLLQLWQSQGHRTLLFCQTKQMLDILEKLLVNLTRISDGTEYFNYMRMDGSTPISKRQGLVDMFNNNTNYDVFLLTTKVGGLGVNLTGADRVIIYDPDWNPSTDIQARERAWRLGQKRDIVIYRLMTAGTIEEKIYHRQIFKTFLTNKILKDPKQRRFFKVNDLHDLFTLGDPEEKGTETGDMFNGSEINYSGSRERKPTNLKNTNKNDDDFYSVAKLNGVSKLDKFQGGDDDEDARPDEDRIMEGLFSNDNIHSTVKHDSIIDSSNQEISIIEKEANKLAAEAAEALKNSRKQTRKNTIGTPTWTGKFGLAGRFGVQKPKRTNVAPFRIPRKSENSELSSSSVLSDLRRNKKATREAVFSKKPEKLQNNSVDKLQLMLQVVDYLQSQKNHFSTSAGILQGLKIQETNDQEVILLRSLLKEAATWDRENKGWILKSEYVNNDAA